MLLHQCQYLVPFAWKVRLGSILHYSRERVLALLSHTLSPRQIPLMFFLELAKSLLSHCIYISNLTFPTFTCTPFSFIFPFFSSLLDTRYNYFKIKDHFSQSLQPYINFFFFFTCFFLWSSSNYKCILNINTWFVHSRLGREHHSYFAS